MSGDNSSDDKRTVRLVSREGEEFVVAFPVMSISVLVGDTISEQDEDDPTIQDVPLPNVSTDVLKKVVAFCTKFHEEPMTQIQTPLRSSKLEDLVQPWYAEFVKVPREMLFDLVSAANYMDIKALLDLTCLAVSILIKGKSAAELREMFNLTAELTPEEEAQAEADNANASASGSGPAAAPGGEQEGGAEAAAEANP